MSEVLPDFRKEFRRLKHAAEAAMAQIGDEQFFTRPGEMVNPVALIVKHVAGNLASRWTDFLTTDGEKPGRDRDGEFLLKPHDTRANLMTAWEQGWAVVLNTVDSLREEDLGKTIRIRNEPMTTQVAILRALTHLSYHVGQITYLMRLLAPEARWLTIAPGESSAHNAAKFSAAK